MRFARYIMKLHVQYILLLHGLLGLCGIYCTNNFFIMPDIFHISTRTNPNRQYNNIAIERGYIGLRPIF